MLNTLKPQTDEVTLIVPLKSCWMPLDTQHPPNHRSSPSIIEARTIQVYGGSTLQPTGPPERHDRIPPTGLRQGRAKSHPRWGLHGLDLFQHVTLVLKQTGIRLGSGLGHRVSQQNVGVRILFICVCDF